MVTLDFHRFVELSLGGWFLGCIIMGGWLWVCCCSHSCSTLLVVWRTHSMLDNWTKEEGTEVIEMGTGVLVIIVIFILGSLGESTHFKFSHKLSHHLHQ